MLIGICGKPNTGKSTFFSAATLVKVDIADYPFTTIKPNVGVTYVRAKCPHTELGVKCNPQNSKCEEGVRLIPARILDVAGLVPGAHMGKGLGNQFLDDLRAADVLIQIVDASGKTDAEGKPGAYDPILEVKFLEDELAYWIAGIIKRGMPKIKGKDIHALAELLSGLNIGLQQISRALELSGMSAGRIAWSEEETVLFSRALLSAKPILIAANKIDVEGAHDNYERMRKEFGDRVMPCYADGELALRRANEKGIVRYTPGDGDFEILNADARQTEALEKIRRAMSKYGGTGVQQIINKAVFELLGQIIVYPVEDENRYSDHFGNVLPHAFLMPSGATAIDLAKKIHTELAENFICAIDARTKMKIGREHVLKNNDVIKIVARR